MVTVALSWLLLLLLLGHCSIHDKGHAFIYFQKDCCLYISSLLWDCGIALSKDLRKFVGAVCVMEHHKVKSSYRSQQIILVLYSLGLAFHRLRFMVGRRTSWKLPYHQSIFFLYCEIRVGKSKSFLLATECQSSGSLSINFNNFTCGGPVVHADLCAQFALAIYKRFRDVLKHANQAIAFWSAQLNQCTAVKQ